MLSISEKTAPFVTNSMPELLNEVSAAIANGYLFYSALRSPDGSAAFDAEVTEEVERVKWAAQGEGFKPLVKYFRTGLSGLLLSTEASFFGACSRNNDIRETPLDFCEYRITCREARGSYETSFSINSDLMAMHSMTLTRPIHSVETVGRVLRKLLEVSSPEIIDQVETILRAANVKRKEAGAELVSRTAAGLPEAAVLPMAAN